MTATYKPMTGCSKAIMDFLTKYPNRAFHAHEIARRIGFERKQVTGNASNLLKQGRIITHERGVYQVSPAYMENPRPVRAPGGAAYPRAVADAMHERHAAAHRAFADAALREAAEAQGAGAIAAPVQGSLDPIFRAEAARSAGASPEDAESLLLLLFPRGVPVAKFAAALRWIEATKELLA